MEQVKLRRRIGRVMVCVVAVMYALYVMHCAWVTSEAYSSPSIVLAAKQNDGSRIVFDDFRCVGTRILTNATRTHAHTRTRTHAHSHAHTHTRTLTYTQTHTLAQRGISLASYEHKTGRADHVMVCVCVCVC